MRAELSQGLGFSRADRDENVRRIAFMAKVLNRNGVPAVVAAISPFREARARARGEIPVFVEVHCAADADTCAARDRKGTWQRARAGEITNFTGVDDPYEAPEQPELRLDTGGRSVEECLAEVLAYLEGRGLAPTAAEGSYTSDEAAEVAARLEALGYM
jgi:adenylylsulfate kinase-like enzyme